MAILNTKNTSWDFSSLFSSDNDPLMDKEREEIMKKSYEFIDKWKKNDKYLSDAHVLKEALDEYDTWSETCANGGKQGYYFSYKYYLNMLDTEVKAKMNKIDEFQQKIQNDIQFFTLNISKINDDKKKEFLESPLLSKYKHFLEQLFAETKYLLSEPEEKILNLKLNTSYSNWIDMVDQFLSKEEREMVMEDGSIKKIGYEELMTIMSSNDKKTRDEAAKHIHDIMAKNADIAEHEINAILRHKKVNDELRGAERPDTMRHLADDVDTEVVDALVEAVTTHFDISRKYYEFKAKLFGFSKLAYHERSLKYGDVDQTYSYQEAVDLVYKVFNNLDSEFGDIFKDFVEKGHIDVYPKKGKTGGAFCSYGSKTNPIFLLINFTNKLNDVTTIAHESGHGINHELMNRKQDSINRTSSKFTAEVSSTFMEDFVLEDIMKDADEETKFSLMVQKLDSDIATVFRQIACYNFEWELHKEFREKGFLSKDEIGKIFIKHMESYMGDFISYDPGSENWWVYWGHIRSFFYVYSYASGILISKSMQNYVRKDKAFIDKIKLFLSTGGSLSPKDNFAQMDIDITDKEFWNKGINEINDLLKSTEQLAKKLKKI